MDTLERIKLLAHDTREMTRERLEYTVAALRMELAAANKRAAANADCANRWIETADFWCQEAQRAAKSV